VKHVEVAGPHAGQKGGALDQLVPRHRVQPSGRGPLQLVVGSAHALQKGPDGPGRADLADQLHRAHVDAQFERGRGHQGPEVPGPESLLDHPPSRRRQAAVVGRHLQTGIDRVGRADGGAERFSRADGGAGGDSLGARPESESELVRDPLGHLAGVDEDQGGAMFQDVVGDPVEDVGELGPAGHRLELAGGELDGHVEVAPVPAVHDAGGGAGRVHARQEAGHHVEWSLRGREPDALEPAARGRNQVVQPLERQGKVGAALVPGQGVDLVDDHRVDVPEHRPRRGRRQ
jgi:hypothetical protein